jgi:hypothetical protein
LTAIDPRHGRFPQVRMRRMRRDDFSRRLMRENRLSADDLIQPMFILEGEGQREAVASMPGVDRVSIDELLKEAAELVALGVPAVALFPVTPVEQEERGCPRGLQPRGPGAARRAGAEGGIPHARRHHRRGPRPLHHPWPGRSDRRLRLCAQRGDRGRSGPAGPVARRGRRRRGGPFGHDGRAHRRRAPGPRGGRSPQHPHPRLCRQVCLQLLRPLPRRRGLRGQSGRWQQVQLPDGPGQQRRSPVGGVPGPGGGRRHDHGQARHALPGHRAAGQGRLRRPHLRVPGERRVRHAHGRGPQWLAGRTGRGAGVPAGLQARRCRRHPHLFRQERRALAARDPGFPSFLQKGSDPF